MITHMSPDPHSSAFLNDNRMATWQADFVALLLTRGGALNAASMAEFGCGRGHWLRLLIPHLTQLSRIELIDTEPTYLEECDHALSSFPRKFSLRKHSTPAHQTKLETASVDLVTCHTLLLHTQQPDLVLAEMFRVLKPGGVLLVAEPINILNRFPLSEMLHFSRDFVHEYLDLCLDLHQSLAEADCDENIGRRLATLVPAAGFTDVQYHQNDKCYQAIPEPCDVADAWKPSLQNLPPSRQHEFATRYESWARRYPAQTAPFITPASDIIALARRPITTHQ